MEYTLKLTLPQIHVIGNALGNRPYAEVVGVVNVLEAQVKAQSEKTLLEQCRGSGQMDSKQLASHQNAGEA